MKEDILEQEKKLTDKQRILAFEYLVGYLSKTDKELLSKAIKSARRHKV